MGNYVIYETKSQYSRYDYYDERLLDKAKRELGKYFTADENTEPLFELMAYGYTTVKYWEEYTNHLKIASKVLNKPLIVFFQDEDGWYNNIDIFHQDGWYYGCNKRDFVIGLIKKFDLDPFHFVCIPDEELRDCILNEFFDKTVEYANSRLIKGENI